MFKIRILLMAIAAFILSGCSSTAPLHSVTAGRPAYVETDLIGVYKGAGLLKSADGHVIRSFDTTLKGYKENGVIFLQETYSFDTGKTEHHTYRITPTENNFVYDCVQIETLDSCVVLQNGGTISLEITTENVKPTDVEITNAKQLFHFFGQGRMIKNTYYNKFLMVHDKDEIIHYTKVTK